MCNKALTMAIHGVIVYRLPIPCPQIPLPYHHENMAVLIARNSLSGC